MGNKAAAIVITLAALTGIGFLATRKPGASGQDNANMAATVRITVGARYTGVSQVYEGTSTPVKLTIKNLSTVTPPGGSPLFSRAILKAVVSASSVATVYIPLTVTAYNFGPEETHTFEYTLNAPVGSGADVITITGFVTDPSGNVLAAASSVSLTVLALPIDYGASLNPIET